MSALLEYYDYDLPTHLIAQRPLARRDQARMLLLHRGAGQLAHQSFSDLPGSLPGNSLLVLNNTRVPPRRLTARLPTGVRIEALLVAEEEPGRWRAMVKKARRVKVGMEVPFADGHLTARALERTEEGQWRLQFSEPDTFRERLAIHGLAPLPPYIRRDIHNGYDPRADREAYQTCYAKVEGSIAAPTAGFHFTPSLMDALGAAGIEVAELTLHVGPGTFARITVADPARHAMQREWYEIPPRTAAAVAAAREAGRPVIAVGTTTVRALESWAAAGAPAGHSGWAGLFICPPYAFQVVDGLITNFHLPRSTLLMLVSAFHGRERLLAAYREAIAHGYRFFSFGDCMAILPHPA